MKQRMVVTALRQGESGWSAELKTVDEKGEKDWKGFAQWPLTDDDAEWVRVGLVMTVEMAATVAILVVGEEVAQ